jgi:signal transduction histidine kinase
LEDGLSYIDAVERLPEPSFVVTAQGLLLDANRAGRKLLGITDMRGGLSLGAALENPAPQLESFLRLCARSRSPLPGRLVWRSAYRSAPSRVMAWCIRPASDGQTALIAMQCKNAALDRFIALNEQLEHTQREVAARQQAQAELETALKARDDFIAVAAHELRNPLNVLHLTLQLLHRIASEPANLSKIQSALEKSRTQLGRLTATVDRLLDVTRLQAGKLILRREHFDLADLVKEIAERYRDAQPGAAISIEGAGVHGNWDRLRLDQAITNLISNAVKYGMGKPIVVQLTAEGSEATVVVHDQGIGLSAADCDRIFNRFERAVPYTFREGLGLGLWITKRIIEGHGGTVVAQGEPGKGSVFTVRLPRSEALPSRLQ